MGFRSYDESSGTFVYLAAPADSGKCLITMTRCRDKGTGTLKSFHQGKGFGFFTPDDGGDDCFADVKDNPELQNSQKGDSVTFDKVWDDRKGKYKAENVSGGGGGGGGGW